MKKILSILLLSIVLCLQLNAQQKFNSEVQLKWKENGLIRVISDGTSETLPHFDEGYFSQEPVPVPMYHKTFKIDGPAKVTASLKNIITEPLRSDYDLTDANILSEVKIKTTVTKSRNQYLANVDFCPIIKEGQNFKKIVSFDLVIQTKKSNALPKKNPTFKTTSILKDGEIYKIAIEEQGMHVIGYDFLKSELGLDIDNINPNRIQIYGAGGGMLPEQNSIIRTDDLEPIAMTMTGTQDGVFNSGDKIVFYAESASIEKSDISTKLISSSLNVYDRKNYYFLKVGDVSQNLIQEIPSISNTDGSTDQYDHFVKIEEDKINILHDYPFTQGSGSIWYMQKFDGLREQDYDLTIPNVVPNSKATFTSVFAGRSEINSNFRMSINGVEYTSGSITKVSPSNIESPHASRKSLKETETLNSDKISIKIAYPQINFASSGWLDYISVNARCRLILSEDELVFRDFNSINNTNTTFNLQSSASDTRIWNITNPLNAKKIKTNTNTGDINFGSATATLQKFIAFDFSQVSKTPEFVEKIENQNLHEIANADMIIIYPTEFADQAEQLAKHRRSFSQLDVKPILIDEIYNEFSSGRQDPSAIRDFCRMIYGRDQNFKYLLLFGDGSFDHRGVYEDIAINSNFIPVYEEGSLNPITAYPMDDYFGLLDPEEGNSPSGSLELAIGRFPVKTSSEAQLVVNKIINYETSSNSLGNWRNDIAFVADDEDKNTHLNDADGIAEMVRAKYGQYNVNKLYADSYVQVSTPGGEKYPKMTDELNKVMFQGALLVNYLGHGGSKGWAQERFLDLNVIDGWTNINKQPLMVTATCSFTGFDDPSFVTAGERCFINNNGGVIGLMTTVRAVFAHQNEALARSVFERIFEKENGQTLPFGDVMMQGKNANANENTRKFALIGDPAMRIAIPQNKVQTLTINGNPVDSIIRDTMHALDRVAIAGQLTDQNDQLLPDFNGKVFVKIFDKVSDVPTLVNDSDGSRPSLYTTFKSQKNLIFSGVASVTNGKFDLEFVVPKDINYAFGQGKISYYATDEESKDAGGYFTGFIVGGTNPDGIVDNEPPKVEVFMDNFNFVLGGTTTPDPILLVKLSDNLGINVAGSSIGHNLTGVLDQDNSQSLALNDFYEAKLDDFTQGTVRFPLFDLESGRHEIKVRAWDVANNSAEGYTEFIVADNQSLALEQVLNYPNPFTTSTSFMFEHNLPGQLLDVQVRIFTVSGKLVKSITTEVISDGNSVRNIKWDGKDDFGADIARGVYLYKVKASPSDNNTNIKASESEFEKLVILK